jgi:hypothetical protein
LEELVTPIISKRLSVIGVGTVATLPFVRMFVVSCSDRLGKSFFAQKDPPEPSPRLHIVDVATLPIEKGHYQLEVHNTHDQNEEQQHCKHVAVKCEEANAFTEFVSVW